MATKYAYSIINDFPNQKVNLPNLRYEILALGGTATLLYINKDIALDTVDVWIDRDLTGPEKSALDGVITAHLGTEREVFILHASTKLVDSVIQITTTTPWQELGGVVMDPTLLIPAHRLSNAFIRVLGAIKTDGTEVQVTIGEDLNSEGSSIVSLVTPVLDIPNTSDGWVVGEFDTNVALREGKNTYTIGARLRGSTSAALRYAQAMLFEKRLYA
jgi:hypothetical protein